MDRSNRRRLHTVILAVFCMGLVLAATTGKRPANTEKVSVQPSSTQAVPVMFAAIPVATTIPTAVTTAVPPTSIPTTASPTPSTNLTPTTPTPSEVAATAQASLDPAAIPIEAVHPDGIQPAARVDRKQVTTPPTLVPPNPGALPKEMAHDLEVTYNVRFCFAGFESMTSGLYTARYHGPVRSDAAGAYQFTSDTWHTVLPRAESYYGIRTTTEEEEANGARLSADYADPFIQDLAAAWALTHIKELGWNPWDHPTCMPKLGSEPVIQESFPVQKPTEFIYDQYIDQDLTGLFALSP